MDETPTTDTAPQDEPEPAQDLAADITITFDDGTQQYIHLDLKTIRRRIKVKDQARIQGLMNRLTAAPASVEPTEWHGFIAQICAIPVASIDEWSLDDVETVGRAIGVIMTSGGSAIPQRNGATSS
jgi:hypothetical protein